MKNQIERQFTKSDWIEIGFALGVSDIINGHDRLLRSLSFGDDDYEGNILDVLNQIVKKNPSNFEELNLNKLIRLKAIIIKFNVVSVASKLC